MLDLSNDDNMHFRLPAALKKAATLVSKRTGIALAHVLRRSLIDLVNEHAAPLSNEDNNDD